MEVVRYARERLLPFPQGAPEAGDSAIGQDGKEPMRLFTKEGVVVV